VSTEKNVRIKLYVGILAVLICCLTLFIFYHYGYHELEFSFEGEIPEIAAADIWFDSGNRLVTVHHHTDPDQPIVELSTWTGTIPKTLRVDFSQLEKESAPIQLVYPKGRVSSQAEDKTFLRYALSSSGTRIAWTWKDMLSVGEVADLANGDSRRTQKIRLPDGKHPATLGFLGDHFIAINFDDGSFQNLDYAQPWRNKEKKGSPFNYPWTLWTRGPELLFSFNDAAKGSECGRVTYKDSFNLNTFGAICENCSTIARSHAGRLAIGKSNGEVHVFSQAGELEEISPVGQRPIVAILFYAEDTLIVSDSSTLTKIEGKVVKPLTPMPTTGVFILAHGGERLAFSSPEGVRFGRLAKQFILPGQGQLYFGLASFALALLSLYSLFLKTYSEE
jgi:hypothetical protein